MNHLYLLLLSLFFFCGVSGKIYSKDFVEHQVFDCRIDLNRSDSTKVRVEEQIVLSFSDRPILGGIVRSIPIRNNENHQSDINILEARCNDHKTVYSTIVTDDSLFINIGCVDVVLPIGTYKYKLIYESSDPNLISNDMDYLAEKNTQNSFAIDSLSASFNLLVGNLYVNRNEKRASEMKKTYSSSSFINLVNNNIILTKLIRENNQQVASISNLSHTSYNGIILISVGFVLLLLYYFFKWKSIAKKTLCGNSSLPQNTSAGAIRYLYKEFADVKLLTTILISMAVKKFISIEKKDSIFNIIKMSSSKNLSAEEKFVYHSLFYKDRLSISIDWDNASTFDYICNHLKGCLAKEYNVKDYFVDRRAFLFDSRSFSITLLLGWVVLSYFLTDISVFSEALRVSIIGVVLSLFLFVRNMLKDYDRFKHIMLSCFVCFFSLILLLLFFQLGIYSKLAVLFVLSIIGFNIYFTRNFKKLATKGQEVMDEMESIRRYIKRNKHNRLTKEQIGTILPYAVALDQEKVMDILLKQQGTLAEYKLYWYIDNDSQKTKVNILWNLSKNLTYKIADLCSKRTLYSRKQQ